jgi:hypothetical protein
MRARDAEALRLEQDYLARVRLALLGRPAEEIADVVQAIREHIDEEAPGGPEGVVTLGAIAAVMEHLGPPEVYGSGGAGMAHGAAEGAGAPAGAAAAAAGPAIAAAASAGVDYVRQPFEYGRVVGDAAALYGQNIVPLLLASLVYALLLTGSLFVLIGPLTGGVAVMLLAAVERPDHKVDVGDMFRAFGQFWPLTGAAVILTVCSLLGAALCLVPGIVINTLWGFAILGIVDKKMGVFEALRSSAGIVLAPGRFGTNFLLTGTEWIVVIAASFIPYVGVVFSIVLAPLMWLIWVLAYVRQTRGAEAAVPTGANGAVTTAVA